MIFCGLWWKLQNSLVLNSGIQGSFKKCSLLFRHAEIIFVVIWFLDHFTRKPVPPVNSVWIITFVRHLHVWVTKFKPTLVFFKLPILTSNSVIWVDFSAILFDKAQHIVKSPRRATCLFVMRSSWSIKMFCWCFSFLNSRACIWLSRSVMGSWCSSCIFSMPFLVSHSTKAWFLDRTAISIEPSRLMKISWESFVLPREGVNLPPFRSDLGRNFFWHRRKFMQLFYCLASGWQYATYSFSSSVICLRYIYIYIGHMLQYLYPLQQIIVHHFFESLIDDNSGSGGKAFNFFANSTQALLHQHYWCMFSPDFFCVVFCW